MDAQVSGRGAGHPFEAEATTRFFGRGARALTRRSKTYTRPSGLEKWETDARGEISVSFGFERKGLEALHKGGRYSGPYIQHISLLVGRKKLVTDHPTDHPTIQRSHAQIVASLPLKR